MGDVNETLRELYYNASQPSAFGGVQPLYKAAKARNPSIKLTDVRKWLSGENTYTLHKPARRRWKRNRIFVSRMNQQWQADLVELQEFKNQNDDYRYLLTVIDVFSKFAWVVPLKDKTGKSVRDAFESIFSDRKPEKIQTDKGKEFIAKIVQNLFEKHQVLHFTSLNTDIKCAVVERFNRTLKSKMFRYFTAQGTRRYINRLGDFVTSYNESYHRSIKMRPIDVTPQNRMTVLINLYGVSKLHKAILPLNIAPPLSVGDTVRKKYVLKPFDKSYYPTWTDQVFTVEKTIDKEVKPLFKIKDNRGTIQANRFHPEELQRVTENEFRIEKIVKSRKRRGVLEHLVKWVGYSDLYNQWIPASEIRHLS